MRSNDLEQYAAVFVLRISVANDPRIVTRFETYFFNVSSADGAYHRAIEFGPSLDYEYRNSDGEIVTIKCLGLHDLDRVDSDGEDYPGLVSSAEYLTQNWQQPDSQLLSPAELRRLDESLQAWTETT